MNEIVLKGIPAAPGIAMGPAYIVNKQEMVVPARAIMEKEVPIEIARFEEALIKTREQIAGIRKKISEQMGGQDAQIFDAHLLVLEDRMLIEEVSKRIQREKQSAEYIFSNVFKRYAEAFKNIQDDYLKERTADLKDIARRVLRNLIDEDRLSEIDQFKEEFILIAHDLSPSDTASMVGRNVLGFVTDIGGRTSHTAIMAKSLGIPAVVGLKDATMRISNQDEMIVDGRMGLVIIRPEEKTREIYRKEKGRIFASRGRFADIKDLPAETLDKRTITLATNLELPGEIPLIKRQGPVGIGLFRTEYFYMNRVDLPSEEEQLETYQRVVRSMAPHPVTIRTLDLGGDKFISSLQVPRDMVPFLGWRAIKFCLARPDIFKTQIRAILKASAHGKIKMMYPMISGVSEMRQANAILEEVKMQLREEKIAFDENIQVGAMIEVPSAAVTADSLAQESDFFSIGTNDLIQYALAVGRVNEQTASFYEPFHPSILRLIKMAVDAGYQAHIPVSLCGEMASEPVSALLLLGMGIDELSMTPLNVLQIKKLIRSVRFTDAQKLAQEALSLSTGQDVEELCKAKLQELAPAVLKSGD